MKALETEFTACGPGRIARVIVHGRKSLNVVDADILRAARDEFVALCETPDLRCIVMRGPGSTAFIGGADLNALHALTPATAERFIRSIHDLCTAMRTAPVPVVAVMRGFCLGAGLEIAAAADLRIGDHSVRCGMPEVRVGVPSVVEAALLPQLIGTGKARELMLRGNIIDAEESCQTGLLQHLVASDELDALVDTICTDIVAAGPRAIAAQKRLFLDWEELPMSAAIERGVEALVAAYDSDEPQRLIDNFFAARGKSR